MIRFLVSKYIAKNIKINIALSDIIRTFAVSLALISQVHFAYAQSTTQGGVIPNAQPVFLDNNGKPVSNGKVYFYVPGQTTSKTTYADINQTVPNTNPVLLNGSGRPNNSTGGLWGTGSYRQIVQDKNGNVIWDQVTSSAGSGSGGSSSATGDGDAVGTIKPWAGAVAPNQYMFTYGQSLSRTTYAPLFAAITSQQSVFCTSGSAILNGVGDTTSFWIGMTVEVSCIPSGSSTIISKTSSSVTLATNANVSINTTATFFMWGNGDGALTFNLPDFRGLIPMGNNIMGGVASSNISDSTFGSKLAESNGGQGGSTNGGSVSLGLNNIPPGITSTNSSQAITVTGPSTGFAFGNFPGTSAGYASGANVLNTSNSVVFQGNNNITVTSTTGSSSPFPIIPPVKTVNFIIKVTPDSTFSGTGVTSLGGMTGDIACGSGLVCAGNTISSLNLLTPPTPTQLGGVFSKTCATSNWFNTLDTTGTFGCSQPNFTDLAGAIGSSQITNSSIVYAKIQNVTASRLLGNPTGGAASPSEISLGPTLNFSGISINCTTATASVIGCLRPDGTSITIAGGVISAPTGGSGNVTGTGTSVINDLPIFTNTSTTAISDAGYNVTQIPGLIPSTSTVTINIATSTITWTAHGLADNSPVYFCSASGGALPTGLSTCVFPTSGSTAVNTYMTNPTVYYVVGSTKTANTFQVASSIANAKAGTAITLSGTQSGTITAFANAAACTGCIGEHIYNLVPAVATTTNVGTTNPVACNNSSPDTLFNSITLQPGIWKVWGSTGVFGSGGAVFNTNHSSIGVGISSISSTPFNGTTDWHVTTNNSNGVLFPFNAQIIPIFAANTVINAYSEPVWTSGTATCFGDLHAMRIH